MNRILFESSEISAGIATFGGARARHVVDVLHGSVGQIIKTGEINGLSGESVIEEISGGENLTVKVKVNHHREGLGAWADLVLAPPRPRVFKRLLPQFAAMGVRRIFLVGAKKVEKDFWGATILKEENYRPLLLDGLMQCGETELPVIECRRNFRRFIADEIENIAAGGEKYVAHPAENATVYPTENSRRATIAIGPEGGWTDEEVAALEDRGFKRYSLGRRILRTDTAAIALLSQLMPR